MATRKKTPTAKKRTTRKKRGSTVVGPDSPDPKYRGLKAPWKPGQSGNPRGGSRKQRRRKMLKQLIRDAVNIDVPEDWRVALNLLEVDNNLGVLIEEGNTIGEAIVARLVMQALKGDEAAIAQILGSEPKVVGVGEPDEEGDVKAPPVDVKRMSAVAAILQEIGALK